MYDEILLIIICKGAKKTNKIEKCSFLHYGTWGDAQLVEHQKQHELLENSNYSWLGFDIHQSFGNYSGRDGKRI
jgi:hypothetical protein